MKGVLAFASVVLVCLACWMVGTSTAGTGSTGPGLWSGRQMVNVVRGEHIQASYRRCLDEITVYRWHDVNAIPADRVRAVLRTWVNRLADVRSRKDPRAVCWRSHLWAESSAGRCVSSKEGGLTSLSPGGTYAGKWQMDTGFERTYGGWYAYRWGRAYSWPEWAQDVAAYRGYTARGWSPWPSTARSCGLL